MKSKEYIGSSYERSEIPPFCAYMSHEYMESMSITPIELLPMEPWAICLTYLDCI